MTSSKENIARKKEIRKLRKQRKKAKRKAKEALGDDASVDDGPVNASADSPVNQYQTPRSKGGTKRKASRKLPNVGSGDEQVLAAGRAQEEEEEERKASTILHYEMNSGDEQVFAAGRAQEQRAGMASRYLHHADSDDVVLPVNQLQLPLEEEGKVSRTLFKTESSDEEFVAADRAQQRRKRKARRAREEADIDDVVLPVNPLQVPFLQEETEEERKVSSTLYDTESGDEEVLAAGRAQQRRKRKVKRTRRDADSDDEVLPVNQLQVPFLQEETEEERKGLRTLYDTESGDEEVLAADRAQQRRKGKAGRRKSRRDAQRQRKRKAIISHHNADSDDEVLPVNPLQLPFLQEETEEEVNMCEISLKALISRKQKLEKDLSRSRSQEETLEHRRQELQERQLRLQAGRMKHLSLQKQLQDSLAKSQERLARLNPEDEKEEEKKEQDENTKQTDETNSHNIQEEESAGPTETRDLSVIIPGLPAVSMESILLVSVREASAFDHLDDTPAHLNSDRVVRSHRRELVWNTCLDLLQWWCPDDDDTDHKEKDKQDGLPDPQTLSILDPNVSLCPYELSGVCADTLCPYQHMDKLSMLPRERLMLPSLKLPPPSRDNYEADSGRPTQTSEANTGGTPEPKLSVPVTTNNQDQDQLEEEKSQGSIYGTGTLLLHDDMGDASVEPSQSEDDNDNDNAFGEDFISLPMPPIEEESASEDDESVVDDEDVIVSSYLDNATKANSVSFWWDDNKVLERNPTNVIHPNMSVTAWLEKVTGFRILGTGNASEYLRKAPTTASEHSTWLGQLVDIMRVSLHAGRRDITRGVCREWDETLQVPNCLTTGLTLIKEIAFSSSNQAFFKAFTVQVALSVVSQFLQESHMKEGKKMAGDVCQRWVEIVLESDQSTVVGDEVTHGSLVDGLRTELYRSTTLDCDDQDKEGFNVLKANISWAMKLPGIDALSVHQMDNRVLKPAWSLVSRFLRRSVGQDRPFACTRAAIIMGYIILRCLERFSQKVNIGNDNLCASMTAALTTVDSTIYRILLELSDLISDIPLLELILSPLYAASVSTACFLRLYATAQRRLETVLGAQGDKRFQVRKQGSENSVPFARYSELLWSQLCHLRMALPCESPSKDNGEKMYHWEPSPEVIESHKTLGSRIAEYGIHLRHIRLDGARNMSRTRPDGTSFSTALSLALLTGPLEESVEVNIDGVPLGFEQDERTRVPSPLRSSLPRSILLAGQALTRLSLVGCKLMSLPASFGLYFPKLDFLDVSENELESLPVSFRGLFHLKHLLASRNSLLSLPEHLGDLTNLERLNVTTNYLESLPNSLERCTKLEELHVSGNCLQNVDLSQLTLMLPKLRYLKFDPQHTGETEGPTRGSGGYI